MKELKVLHLTGIHLLSLPLSLPCLKNLHTLCLHNCLLGDIAKVGELKQLEILSLVASPVEDKSCPEKIGQWTLLKLLDLRLCLQLKAVSPDVMRYAMVNSTQSLLAD
ncbi:hypothetical protein Patl1_21958 [Pistacia atlantica]|uniref:Uncharacterized protein n=1 Tax=Pistacia atlantica TaxID=434234 RepID=A0ACC1BJ21_9ROSI|nr:hypothetical protein Patl1_21958 [Pistacia atlantica]